MYIHQVLNEKTRLEGEEMNNVQNDRSLFGEFLLRCRTRKGWSLCEVEQQSGGITPSYLHRLEQGKRRNPTMRLIHSLAVVYSVQVTTLVDLLLMDQGGEQGEE
jgi:transcriptional regulator with XRE-family HTH domain